MADCRLHGQAASNSTDSANFYADTLSIFFMLMNHFRETWYSETVDNLKDLGRTRFDTDISETELFQDFGKLL
jgi:hypothetical protein